MCSKHPSVLIAGSLIIVLMSACSAAVGGDEGNVGSEANENVDQTEQLVQGVKSVTRTFGPLTFKTNDGIPRARSRNGSVTWYQDVLDPSNQWVKVSAQLTDDSRDNFCAKIRFSATGFEGYGTECNGVWVTRTASSVWKRQQHVEVIVYRDQSNDDRFEREDGPAALAWIDAPPGWN